VGQTKNLRVQSSHPRRQQFQQIKSPKSQILFAAVIGYRLVFGSLYPKVLSSLFGMA
jgi:hypothetical protein